MSDARFYDRLIMDHIKNARNYRVLLEASHVAAGSNPLCGDEMQVYIRMDGPRIADVAFQCTCCGISMASASIMTTMLVGVDKDEAKLLLREFGALVRARTEPTPEPITGEWRALRDTLIRFPARARCALLPWTTLEQALQEPTGAKSEQI